MKMKILRKQEQSTSVKGDEDMKNISVEIERFGKICCKTQKELIKYLQGFLGSCGYKPVVKDGFIYAKGELPYLVTAHMDTVHKKQCTRYSIHSWKGKHRIQSQVGIGGDDRCGIYMIIRMILDGYRPTVLFCEDEEIGSVGAGKFVDTKYVKDLEKLNYLIELDRANEKDVVFYDCDNPEFTKYITENTGYVEATGSWTDIIELSDACNIASVNFSCGYYKAHTEQEYVIFEEMQNTIQVVEKLLRMECEQFKFIRKQKTFSDRYYLTDDYWDKYYTRMYGVTNYADDTLMSGTEIHFNDYTETGKVEENIVYIPGDTEDECMYEFFRNYPTVCYNDIIDVIIV